MISKISKCRVNANARRVNKCNRPDRHQARGAQNPSGADVSRVKYRQYYFSINMLLGRIQLGFRCTSARLKHEHGNYNSSNTKGD
jgi:hypothetical protein